MTKISIVSVTLAAAAGTALAQPAQPAKPAQPATPTAKPATPATTATPAKPATPAADKKAAPPAAGAPSAPPTTIAPPMPPKAPTPPQELLDLAKAMSGTWKCAGKMTTGDAQVDVKLTIAHKLDAGMGKMWLTSNLNITAPKMPALKVTMNTTFDAAAKKLWRVSINSRGGHSVSTASYDAAKLVFEGDAVGPAGAHKFRHTEEFVSAKEVKITGETSKFGGMPFAPDYEAVCKK